LRAQAPRHFALFHHTLKHLPVSQSIHGPPEPLIFVNHEVTAGDQALERLKDQFLALADEIALIIVAERCV
jgi:hypothetical protein